MNPLVGRLSWTYQKHKHLLDSLVLRRSPVFVRSLRSTPIGDEIPVFTFHIALPYWFERQCLHLAENGYRALSAEEFLRVMTGQQPAAPKSVLITFDDGLKHVWTVAYPLLEKYGLRATCFLIPGCMTRSGSAVRPGLQEVWDGRASEEDVIAFRKTEPALATWEEVEVMHSSGVVDFQSHTMHHALVFTSDRVLDFFHPGRDTHFYGNIHVPLYRRNGREVFGREPLLGMPIYRGSPRMQAESRFFDDEELRMRCVETVDERGGVEFFHDKRWRSELSRVVKEYRDSGRERCRYETPEERDAVVTEELAESRHVIESGLPGKRVEHLCFPWYQASPFAVEAARKAGFKACYFGMRPGRVTNRPGQDPMEVVRVEDLFLERLPGSGRKSLPDSLYQLVRLKGLSQKLFPDRWS